MPDDDGENFFSETGVSFDKPFAPALKRVYWEVTEACNLRCLHCRRLAAVEKPSKEELSTDEALGFIDSLAAAGKPVLIFSGGEPLRRSDILTLISHAKTKGLATGLATNGTLIDDAKAGIIREAGVHYASISLDGATAGTHDTFRGPGNFVRAVKGMRHLRSAGIQVQINFTVTQFNVNQVEDMYELAQSLGAFTLFLFLLVPVGCGVDIAEEQTLRPAQVESWLLWVYRKNTRGPLPVRAICAPQYYRVKTQMDARDENQEEMGLDQADRQGCLAGIHMCFVSHKGDVFPCGYLPVAVGNIKNGPLEDIWRCAPLLRAFRDPGRLEGRCGACGFRRLCGGCRARAFAPARNPMAEEPSCFYDPQKDGQSFYTTGDTL